MIDIHKTKYQSAEIAISGIVGILILVVSAVVSSQQAMADPKSIFEDQKTMDKWNKAFTKGNLDKAGKICSKGGDTPYAEGRACQNTH